VCDGKPDCPGGVDEEECPGVCEVKPGDRSELIPESAKTKADKSPGSMAAVELLNRNADKDVSCGVGSTLKWRVACDGYHPKCDRQCDECNPESAFTCASSANGPKCVPRSMVCDGNGDCGDGSDEANCDCKAPGMTLCKQLDSLGRQRCFTEAQRCDGVRDCPDGEDESGCEACKNGAFHCHKSKMCVPRGRRCDGVKDCPDLTDELDCSCQECSLHPFPMYMCSTGDRCFRMSNVCDPTSQCPPDVDKRDKLYCASRQGLSYF